MLWKDRAEPEAGGRRRGRQKIMNGQILPDLCVAGIEQSSAKFFRGWKTDTYRENLTLGWEHKVQYKEKADDSF